MRSLRHHLSPIIEGCHDAADLLSLDWQPLSTLTPFMLADGSGPAEQQTTVRACADDQALAVHFHCLDRDIWGDFRKRDDPIYEEEVVEIFLSPGSWYRQPTLNLNSALPVCCLMPKLRTPCWVMMRFRLTANGIVRAFVGMLRVMMLKGIGKALFTSPGLGW